MLLINESEKVVGCDIVICIVGRKLAYRYKTVLLIAGLSAGTHTNTLRSGIIYQNDGGGAVFWFGVTNSFFVRGTIRFFGKKSFRAYNTCLCLIEYQMYC